MFDLTNYSLVALSLVAGGMVAISGLPALVAAIIDPTSDHWLHIMRNAISSIGNALWVLFALETGYIAILIFCGLNTVLLTFLVMLQVRHRCLLRKINPTIKDQNHA